MRSVTILSAVMAIGPALVSAQTTCSGFTISEPTPTINCDHVDGDIVIGDVPGALTIRGPKTISGSLNATGSSRLTEINCPTLTRIDGSLVAQGLLLLSNLRFPQLEDVGSIILVNLPQFSTFNFGMSGVTKCNKIEIIDTFISSFTGFRILTAQSINIANNNKLQEFNLDIVNVTECKVVDNGSTMNVSMPRLENAGEIEFRQVRSFDAPALSNCSSIKFNDSPELQSVTANNLTNMAASLTFINNKKLSTLSFESLINISGDVTILNNTDLVNITGLPRLETCGNMLLGGNFEDVRLPKLKTVQGSATITSTADLRPGVCDALNASVRGKKTCTSNNRNANSGDGSGGQSGSGDKTDAAGIRSVNMALLGLAVCAGIAQML